MPNESIIQVFEGQNIRIVWDEKEEKYYFAVADIVQVLTDSADVKQYIKRMRSRDPELDSVWGTICTPHQFVSTDGKNHAVNCASLEGIFRIIQSIPSKKAEPVKRWLAEVGAQRNPKGFDESRQTTQAGGKIAKNARHDLEKELGHSVVSPAKASDYLAPSKTSKQKNYPKKHQLTTE